MAEILVTGATGFVGLHLTRALVSRGERVRVTARATSRKNELTTLGVEVVEADILDRGAVERAMQGVKRVYHTAAVVDLSSPKPDRMMAVNVEGVKNVMESALSAGVKKVLHVSSVAAVGGSKTPTPVDEANPWDEANDGRRHYSRSKRRSEETALSYNRRGLEVTCVNPSLIFGAVDPGPSLGGKFLIDFLKRRLPGYLETGVAMVDVGDVAEGAILAMEKGLAGERYILSAENFHIKELFDELAKVSGVPAPKWKMPYWLAYAAAYLSEIAAALRGKSPALSRQLVDVGRRPYGYYKADKAKRELGWSPRPARETLHDTVQWFRDNHYA